MNNLIKEKNNKMTTTTNDSVNETLKVLQTTLMRTTE